MTEEQRDEVEATLQNVLNAIQAFRATVPREDEARGTFEMHFQPVKSRIYKTFVLLEDKPAKQTFPVVPGLHDDVPFPEGMTSKQILDNQWRHFRDCPKCGFMKGSACRSPACVQLKYAPPILRPQDGN